MRIDVEQGSPSKRDTTTQEEAQERPLSLVLKEKVVEPAAYHIDRVLPKKKPDYANAKRVEAALRTLDPEAVANYEISFLASTLDIILIASSVKHIESPAKSFIESEDRRRSCEVVLHPLELRTLYRALYVLSESIKDPTLFHIIYSYTTKARKRPASEVAIHLLETIDKLKVLGSPTFLPFTHILREVAITDTRFTRPSVLQQYFKGRVVDNTAFWEEGYESLSYVQFPEQDALQHDKRVVRRDRHEIRNETLNRAVRRTHVMGERVEDAVAALRSVPERKRQLAQDEEQVIRHEIKRWQEALSPHTSELSYHTDDELKGYLRSAIACLAAQFIDRSSGPADRDVSKKAKEIFPQLVTGEGDPHYQHQINEFLESSLRNKDPIIVWLLSFRNISSRQKLMRSILRDPDRFIDLEKIMLHQLSKYGLLQPRGEREVIFRRDGGANDQVLASSLHDFLRDMHKLSDKYPGLRLNRQSQNEEVMRERIQFAFKELIADEAPLDEVLHWDNLSDVAAQSAMDRLEQLGPKAKRSIDVLVVKLRLRSGKYSQLLKNNWFDDFQSLVRTQRFPLLRWRGIDQRESRELLDGRIKQRGVLIYSSERVKDLGDLPLVRHGFLDSDLKNFLTDGGVTQIDRSVPHGGFEQVSLEQAISLAEAERPDKIYIVDLPADAEVLPIFTGHQLQEAWCVGESSSPGYTSYLLAVKKKRTDQISDNIRISTMEGNSYPPYSLIDTFDFNSAVAYNSKLSGDPYLQEVHKQFIDDLQRSPLHDGEHVSEVIKVNLKKLELYFKNKRFYDLRVLTPEQSADPLLFAANHPEAGLHCVAAALAVKKFLDTLGIKCSTLYGEVPYFFKGGIFVNDMVSNHAILAVLLPSNRVLEVDFTPPATYQTPQAVRAYFDNKSPMHGSEEYKTKFGKEKSSQKASLMRTAVIGILVGSIAFAGIDIGTRSGLIQIGRSSDSSGQTSAEVSEESAQTEEDGSGGIDWKNFPFDKVLIALGLTAAGGVGFLSAYSRLEYARRRREWSKYKTGIEKHFAPTEQIVMTAVLYPMKKSGEINDKELRRALKLLREFEMNAAQPLLELLAMLMNSGSEEFGQQFEDAVAESDFLKLYNLVAEASTSFVPKNELQMTWMKRLFTKRDPILQVLQDRGREIQKRKNIGDMAELSVEQGDRNYRLFCRGIGILELIQELKTQLDLDLSSAKMLSELEHSDAGMANPSKELSKTQKEFAAQTFRAKHLVSSDIRELIYQVQRSLRNGAVELMSPEELEEIIKELKGL